MLLSQRITGLCDAILAGRFIGDRLAIIQELRRYVEEAWVAEKVMHRSEDVARDYGARACCTPVVLSVGQEVLSRDANGDWRPARLTSVNPLGAYPFEVEYLDGRSATSIGGTEVQTPKKNRPLPSFRGYGREAGSCGRAAA